MSVRGKFAGKTMLAAALALAVTAAAPMQAQARVREKAGYAIASSQIMSLLGPSLAEEMDYRLTLPAVVSRVADPKLKVEAKTLRESVVRLRIGCTVSQECLPFYASLHFGSTAAAQTFADLTVAERRGPPRRAPMLVHGGALAKLEVVVSGDVRLYFYVRCLQSGAAGDRIRARDEKTRKIYLAQVGEQGELRSEL
jgi:hypothetical protein